MHATQHTNTSMIEPELLAFVRQEITRGTPVRDFSRTLLGNGWTAEEIEHTLSAVTGQHFNTTQSGTPHTYVFPSFGEFLKEGVQTIQKNAARFAVLIGVGTIISALLLFILPILFSITSTLASFTMVALLSKALIIFVSACVSMGVIAIVLYPTDSSAAIAKRLMNDFFPFIWSGMLFVLVLSGGFLLLIVPAVIMFFSYSLWPVIVMGEEVSGSRAFVRSSAFIAEHRSQYIVRFLAIVFLLFGAQFIVLGLMQSTTHLGILIIGAFVNIILSVVYHTFLTVLYRSMKFAYAGHVVPTGRKRLLIIAFSYLPILFSGVMVVFFFSMIKKLFE